MQNSLIQKFDHVSFSADQFVSELLKSPNHEKVVAEQKGAILILREAASQNLKKELLLNYDILLKATHDIIGIQSMVYDLSNKLNEQKKSLRGFSSIGMPLEEAKKLVQFLEVESESQTDSLILEKLPVVEVEGDKLNKSKSEHILVSSPIQTKPNISKSTNKKNSSASQGNLQKSPFDSKEDERGVINPFEKMAPWKSSSKKSSSINELSPSDKKQSSNNFNPFDRQSSEECTNEKVNYNPFDSKTQTNQISESSNHSESVNPFDRQGSGESDRSTSPSVFSYSPFSPSPVVRIATQKNTKISQPFHLPPAKYKRIVPFRIKVRKQMELIDSFTDDHQTEKAMNLLEIVETSIKNDSSLSFQEYLSFLIQLTERKDRIVQLACQSISNRFISHTNRCELVNLLIKLDKSSLAIQVFLDHHATLCRSLITNKIKYKSEVLKTVETCSIFFFSIFSDLFEESTKIFAEIPFHSYFIAIIKRELSWLIENISLEVLENLDNLMILADCFQVFSTIMNDKMLTHGISLSHDLINSFESSFIVCLENHFESLLKQSQRDMTTLQWEAFLISKFSVEPFESFGVKDFDQTFVKDGTCQLLLPLCSFYQRFCHFVISISKLIIPSLADVVTDKICEILKLYISFLELTDAKNAFSKHRRSFSKTVTFFYNTLLLLTEQKLPFLASKETYLEEKDNLKMYLPEGDSSDAQQTIQPTK